MDVLLIRPFSIFRPQFEVFFPVRKKTFNSAKHSVQINITTGTRLSEISKTITVERVDGYSPRPRIKYVYDLGSDSRNEVLTPGNIAQVRGSRLKFDATDEQQGIFLIATDNTETKVTTVSRNKPAQLDFLVPALAAGEYRLVIRTLFSNTKTIRSGQSDFVLTIT